MSDIASEANFTALFESGWGTTFLVGIALTWPMRGNYRRDVWTTISTSQEEAREYVASLDGEQERRESAVCALLDGGWTLGAINFAKS